MMTVPPCTPPLLHTARAGDVFDTSDPSLDPLEVAGLLAQVRAPAVRTGARPGHDIAHMTCDLP